MKDAEAPWIEHDGAVLRIGGSWTGAFLPGLQPVIAEAGGRGVVDRIDGRAIASLDTVGAVLIDRLSGRSGDSEAAAGAPVDFGDRAHETLFALVVRTDYSIGVGRDRVNALIEMAERCGRATFTVFREGRLLLGFYGLLTIHLARLLLAPRRLRVAAAVTHMERTGLDAIPIVALLSFLIGVVMAYQGADQLRQFGAEIYVVNLVAIGMLRELGILVTSIIVAGRSGSAFTAQIGTMKVSEEVDAMRAMGLDPIDLLVIPRVLALMVTLPMLTFLSDLMGIAGGAVMSLVELDITFGQFITQLHTSVSVRHLIVGLVKAPVFAFVIAMIGCLYGLKVSGSAESVGRLTTQSVVVCIFLVILLDAVFSVLFAIFGF